MFQLNIIVVWLWFAAFFSGRYVHEFNVNRVFICTVFHNDNKFTVVVMSIFLKRFSIFTARCTTVQSAVLLSHVVCPSVRPSVCDVGGS